MNLGLDRMNIVGSTDYASPVKTVSSIALYAVLFLSDLKNKQKINEQTNKKNHLREKARCKESLF